MLKRITLYGAAAAFGFASAFLFVAPKTDKAPEFYGAFAAAMIAAAALILTTFYQNDLHRKRDQELRDKDRIASAIDLCFWLDYCNYELEFIAGALGRIRDKLASQNRTRLDLPADTFRAIVSPRFFDDLTERARTASNLPSEIAGLVAGDLYKTFTIADRIFSLNHAASDFKPSLEDIEGYISLLNQRGSRLREDARLIETYLISIQALPDFPALEKLS